MFLPFSPCSDTRPSPSVARSKAGAGVFSVMSTINLSVHPGGRRDPVRAPAAPMESSKTFSPRLKPKHWVPASAGMSGLNGPHQHDLLLAGAEFQHVVCVQIGLFDQAGAVVDDLVVQAKAAALGQTTRLTVGAAEARLGRHGGDHGA